MIILSNLVAALATPDGALPAIHQAVATVHVEPVDGFLLLVQLSPSGLTVRHGEDEVGIALDDLVALAQRACPALATPAPATGGTAALATATTSAAASGPSRVTAYRLRNPQGTVAAIASAKEAAARAAAARLAYANSQAAAASAASTGATAQSGQSQAAQGTTTAAATAANTTVAG